MGHHKVRDRFFAFLWSLGAISQTTAGHAALLRGASLEGGIGYALHASNYTLHSFERGRGFTHGPAAKVGGSGIVGSLALYCQKKLGRRLMIAGGLYGETSSLNAEKKLGEMPHFYNVKIALHSLWGVRIKLGFSPRPQLLFYLLGGAGVSLCRATPAPSRGFIGETTFKKMLSAKSFGLGMMYRVSRRWSVGLEGVQTQYEKFKFQHNAAIAGDFTTHIAKPSVFTLSFRAAFGF